MVSVDGKVLVTVSELQRWLHMGSISSLTYISLPVFLSRKHPISFFFFLFFKALLGYKVFHTLLYSLRHASMLLAGGFTALILSSFASLSVPSGSILSIPSSNMVLLLRSGEESIFPWMTKNLLSVPRFLFQSVAENSPLTSRSDWSVFSVPPLGFRSLIFFELSLRALN